MCRRNQLWGFAAIAFGLGMFFCGCFESRFLCNCVGFAVIIVGFFMLKNK